RHHAEALDGRRQAEGPQEASVPGDDLAWHGPSLPQRDDFTRTLTQREARRLPHPIFPHELCEGPNAEEERDHGQADGERDRELEGGVEPVPEQGYFPDRIFLISSMIASHSSSVL